VKERIPHTWPLFFAKHGRFTPIQQQAIPPILAGLDTLVVAATASGKTEAVIAPLLERLWPTLNRQSPIQNPQLLYLCPTRALVRDLYERLHPVLAETAVGSNHHSLIAMKTGDTTLPSQMPAILLTTPESTDSLLTRAPKLFLGLQMIVLDEIHLFDNTPRGDHVRCLLPRIERIRQYNRPELPLTQRVALSATVADPAGVMARYLHDGVLVQVAGGRAIEAEIRPLYNLTELTTSLAERSAFKSLVFCNSREEVEETAVFLRQQLAYHADIFVHYSNLDAEMRRDVEDRFAASATAVCVCTSTLELGVDIGTVDDVVLLGAPPDLNSFSQRLGRGGRRTTQTQVLCLPKSPGEWARFEAFLALAGGELQVEDVRTYGFRPSVLIQQIFSLMKQSPTGTVRLADVARVAPIGVDSETIRKIVAQLALTGYLKAGRMGEWKPDEKLQDLLDEHQIYTNIGADVGGITAVNAHTGQTIATTDNSYPPGTILLFGGQPMQVMWVDRFRFGLAPVASGTAVDDILSFRKSYAAIPYMITQAVARSLGIPANGMVTLPQEQGQFLFHFWGTIWGELLTAVLQVQGVSAKAVNEYCLYLNQPVSQLPPCPEKQLTIAARNIRAILENRLQMGRFHGLLPADVALAATLQQLNLPRLAQLYNQTHLLAKPEINEKLDLLLL
ncbi:MAG: DEAD/DEAH box helicase, partial [Anaerolineae bacterium]|nr:DEAD/DEAH box helicase [Anaerolineae bacterium]